MSYSISIILMIHELSSGNWWTHTHTCAQIMQMKKTSFRGGGVAWKENRSKCLPEYLWNSLQLTSSPRSCRSCPFTEGAMSRLWSSIILQKAWPHWFNITIKGLRHAAFINYHRDVILVFKLTFYHCSPIPLIMYWLIIYDLLLHLWARQLLIISKCDF